MQCGVLSSVAIASSIAVVFCQSGSLGRIHLPLSPVMASEAISIDAANGQIIQIEGEVRLERQNGETVAPTTGMLLYPGDRLLGDREGRAFVQCSDLTIDSVGGRFSRSNPCASVESLLARRNNGQCNSDSYRCPHRGGENSTQETIPYVISPRRTYLLNSRPQFRWNAVAETETYRVCLKETGIKLWCRDVSQAHMSYPTDEPPLKSGEEYLLTVETDGDIFSLDEPTIPGGVGFQLLDTEQAEQIEQTRSQIARQDLDETAKALAIVFLYTDNGLISEAIEILEELVTRGVVTAPIYNRLNWLYSDYLALSSQGSQYDPKVIELSNAE